MFEMAVPIQSPAKFEVRSVIRLLNVKGERPAETHKQIVAVYGNPAISTCFFTYRNILLGKSSTMMMRCKKKSRRSSKGRRQTSMTRDTEAASKT